MKKIYATTNPWDKQKIKIDNLPAEGDNLKWSIASAEKALQGDREERHRFLTDDDNEIRQYLNKLYKIQNALDKHKSGEELNDLEKRIVRFYKSKKQNQKSRISRMAGQKLDKNFVNTFDKSVFKEFEGSAIDVISRDPKDDNRYKAFIEDIEPELLDDGVRFRITCRIYDEVGTALFYQDASNGFIESDDPNSRLNWRALMIVDEKFRNVAHDILQKIRPARDY